MRRQTVLIVGATLGIELACARMFSQADLRLAISGRHVDILAYVAAELGGDTLPAPTDISDYDSARIAVATAWQGLGGIDYLVHATGAVTPAPLSDIAQDHWRHNLDVNLSRPSL